MADQTKWFVRKGEKIHGPFSSKQLQQLAQSSKIYRHTQIRRGDDGEWVAARKLKGLFAASKPAVELITAHKSPPFEVVEVHPVPVDPPADTFIPAQPTPIATRVTCPVCGEEITHTAAKCKHCREAKKDKRIGRIGFLLRCGYNVLYAFYVLCIFFIGVVFMIMMWTAIMEPYATSPEEEVKSFKMILNRLAPLLVILCGVAVGLWAVSYLCGELGNSMLRQAECGEMERKRVEAVRIRKARIDAAKVEATEIIFPEEKKRYTMNRSSK